MDITRKRSKGSGGSGTYYTIGGGRGIKVLGYGSGYRTKKIALASWDAKEARKEYKLLHAARITKLVPKAYGVVAVKKSVDGKKRWFIGLVMEHIPGCTLDAQNRALSEEIETKVRLRDEMRKFGFQMSDLHSANVMVTPEGKEYVIDFTPAYVKRVKPHANVAA